MNVRVLLPLHIFLLQTLPQVCQLSIDGLVEAGEDLALILLVFGLGSRWWLRLVGVEGPAEGSIIQLERCGRSTRVIHSQI